ncbi:hypothetical protein FACS1894178_0890 [Bacteroidia bacterium]|nr:hypothetical protein FACS1894178_0890 [Bacteroidia bacterium]
MHFAQAQDGISNGKSYINAWLAGGYANILHGKMGIGAKAVGGGGLQFGVGYEYKFNNNVLISTGLEFDWKNSTTKIPYFESQIGRIIDENTGLDIPNGTPIVEGMFPAVEGGFYDTEGHQFAMLYKISKYKDVYNVGYINLPILAGMKFQDKLWNSGEYYFLAGLKLGLPIFAHATSKSAHSAYGLYPDAYDAFGNMPEHSFVTDEKTKDKASVSLGFNLAVSAEVGYDLSYLLPFLKDSKVKARIAVFADYSVLSIAKKKNVNTDNVSTGSFWGTSNTETGDPTLIKHNALLSSNQAYKADDNGSPNLNSPYVVNPLMIGVKLTVSYDMVKKKKVKEVPPSAPCIPDTIIIRDTFIIHDTVYVNVGSIDTIFRDDTLHHIIEIEKLIVGDTIKISNALFDVDKYDLNHEFRAELNKLYEYMYHHPEISLEINGHTDNTGSKHHNRELSENRAKAIYNYLKDKGVEHNRMKYEGFADDVPAATNSTAEGRAMNRRTEIIIK